MVIEAMKMEHVVPAGLAGYVRRLAVKVGDSVRDAQPLMFIEPAQVSGEAQAGPEDIDPDYIRPDLAELQARLALTLDAAPPEAVAQRRKPRYRPAPEKVADLCDPGKPEP